MSSKSNHSVPSTGMPYAGFFTALMVAVLLLGVPNEVLSRQSQGMQSGLFNNNPYDSGGLLLPEQAAYRVTFYDLDLEIDPARQHIEGNVRVVAEVVHPTKWLVLDLDTTLTVYGVYSELGERVPFERRGGRIWAFLGSVLQPGSRIDYHISYAGAPRVATNPPWSGGFTWSKTQDGSPWIGVSCQTQGADLWWPVKDHPSDRPDSVGISITVPGDLVVASNGRLRGVSKADDRSTWRWFVSTPINPYNVTVNIAPYETLSDTYESITGEKVETIFWVLPEDVDKGRGLFPQFIEQMRFYEELLGPFPFRAEKYGIVQTPYLGMEHQTIIAYGAGFRDGALFGRHSDYDDLMHHELGHEWWGNLVTVYDWKDFWIHEGFTTYMQALYTERRRGNEAYFENMRFFRGMVDNRAPLAPRHSRTAGQMYQGRDVYYKGAQLLHTLRFLMGDDSFFKLLRRYAYPEPAMELTTDGSAMRYSGTEEFRVFAERFAGRSLSWFFDVYAYQPELPELSVRRNDGYLDLEWITPVGGRFNLPLEVVVDGERRRIEFSDARARVDIRNASNISIDPNQWVLMKPLITIP